MKILHIISGDIWAGAEVQVYNTVVFLSQKKDITLTCAVFNDGVLKQKLDRKNISTHLLDESKFNNLTIIYKLSKFVSKNNFDLLHVHAVKEHLIGKLATILSLKKIPVVRTVHGGRGVPLNLKLAKSLRSNIVVAMDNFLIYNISDHIIAVSKDLEKSLLEKKKAGNVSQIYNALDVSDFNSTVAKREIKKKYHCEDTYWIGTAARLAEPKNLQMLIKAGSYLNEKGVNFKISIFGEGSLKYELQNMINDLSLSEKIILQGFESDIIPVVESLDIFVLCSFHEGLPMSLLESMYVGTPVICTAVGGIVEVIKHNFNGLLVPSDDASALADAILRLIEDRSLAVKVSSNAVKTIEEEFLMSKISKKILNLYSNILYGSML